MAAQTVEKLSEKRIEDIERKIDTLHDEWEEQSRYMASFLATKGEKRISLERIAKKYHLKLPR